MWPMKPIEITLHPVDNLRLANLCGALDENIRQIEAGFDVLIRRRNERFSITGEKAQLTADTIRHFYAIARQPLSVDEIQLGLVQFLNAPVRRITRSAEGPVKLGMLQPGEYRELKKSEINALRNAAQHKSRSSEAPTLTAPRRPGPLRPRKEQG